MEQFNNSLHFDKRLWSADLEGSKAYSKALARAGIITEAERDEIFKGLDAVKVRVQMMIDRSSCVYLMILIDDGNCDYIYRLNGQQEPLKQSQVMRISIQPMKGD